jgi:hypothetical protein
MHFPLVVAAFALPVALAPLPSAAHHGIAPLPRESCSLEIVAADELERLLPADAVVVFRAASVNALLEPFARWSGDAAADPAGALAEWFDSDVTARDVFERLDFERPAGFAVELDETLSPRFTLAFPADDAEGLAALAGQHIPTLRARVSGNYVVLESDEPQAPNTRPNAAALALAGRDLGLHVDLASLRRAFGPLIEMGFDQAEVQLDADAESDPAAALALEQIDDGRRLLASAASFDAYAMLSGANVSLQGRLELQDDSWTRTKLGGTPRNMVGLARLVDPTAAVTFVQSGEQGAHAKQGLAVLELLEDGVDERARPMFALLGRSLELLGERKVDAWVLNLAVGVDGLQASTYMGSPDSAALLESLAGWIAAKEWSELGLEFSGPHESMAGGAAWREYRAKFDVERFARQIAPEFATAGVPDAAQLAEAQRALDALFGSRGLVISLAAKEGLVVMRVGGGEAHALECIARTERPRPSLPPALADAFAAVNGAHAASIVQVDIGRVLAQIESFAAALGESVDLPAGLSGESLPITFHSAAAPRSLWGGLSIDAHQLTRFLQVLRNF